MTANNEAQRCDCDVPGCTRQATLYWYDSSRDPHVDEPGDPRRQTCYEHSISAVADARNFDPNETAIGTACMCFRRDYGLLSPEERKALENEAKEWLRAWQKALKCHGVIVCDRVASARARLDTLPMVCVRPNGCGWIGTQSALLVAVHPFISDDVALGCPDCREVGTVMPRCDVSGCERAASSWWYDELGRRQTCHEHGEEK